jgi:hypothetical protein
LGNDGHDWLVTTEPFAGSMVEPVLSTGHKHHAGLESYVGEKTEKGYLRLTATDHKQPGPGVDDGCSDKKKSVIKVKHVPFATPPPQQLCPTQEKQQSCEPPMDSVPPQGAVRIFVSHGRVLVR